MKNKFILIILILIGVILSTSLVNAVDISIENYYPTPVEAGDYFNIWLKITNNGDNTAEGCGIRFKQAYPFSLDPGDEEEKIVDELKPISSVTKRFKIRVDKEAKEGDNNVAFEYKSCTGCSWIEKSMPITVMEFQTMFDVVLQEVSTDGVFIALANIGKNPANAITVSIPEQDYFRTDLTSASIVGNLDAGDYTIAAFKVIPVERSNEKKELYVQIDYTDPFGVRRTVVEKVLLNPSKLIGIGVSETGTNGEINNMKFGRTSQSSSFYTNIWFWLFMLAVLFIIFQKKIYKIIKKSKR